MDLASLSLERINFKWDREIYNDPNNIAPGPIFYIRTLVRQFGCHVDIHKFTKADDLSKFHTHPAYAIRVVLEGGYVEQELFSYKAQTDIQWQETKMRVLRPGYIGIVTPSFCHRVDSLINGRYSYSLWIRGPVVERIYLRGWGWPSEVRDKPVPNQGEG